MVNKLLTSFKYIFLAALIYMPVFGHITSIPIREWDEARLAINAYEMFKDGNWLVTHFGGQPDMWNTKPPLLIIIQSVGMNIFGVGELPIRLPSAIAAFFTCVALFIVSVRYLKSYWLGFIAVVVLITTNGYVSYHAIRTGDYDAMLALFTTMSGLYFFLFIETKNNKYLYLFFLTMLLGVYTKGISCLMFSPAYMIYAFIRKSQKSLFMNWHFYIGGASFLVLSFSYYLLRECVNPGFIQAVYNNELGGRFLEALEDHKEIFWYYYQNIISNRISSWYLLIPCGVVVGSINKNRRIRNITLFSSVMSLVYFLVISFSQTKCEWYDVPLFPFTSILIAVFIFFVFESIKNNERLHSQLKFTILPFVFLFLLLIKPYQKVIDKTYLPRQSLDQWEKDYYALEYLMSDALKFNIDLNRCHIVYEGYDAALRFYSMMLKEKGVQTFYKKKEDLQSNDIAIVQQDHIKQFIESNYNYEIIFSLGNIKKYLIHEKKSQ